MCFVLNFCFCDKVFIVLVVYNFRMVNRWMGYLAVWTVLEEMVTDFRKKGATVPADVISDLRYAKTLINVLRADSSRLGTSQKVEEILRKVESYFVSEGEKFGKDYVIRWIRRLDEATQRIFDEAERGTRFVSGVPRAQNWIRVNPSAELPIEGLKVLADDLDLSYDVQDDGCLLVYGKEKCIKDFVRKMTVRYGLKAGK